VFRRYAFGLQIQGYLEVTVAVLDRCMLGSMHLVTDSGILRGYCGSTGLVLCLEGMHLVYRFRDT